MSNAMIAGSTSHDEGSAAVRVVIPAYDARRTIRRCVEAIARSIGSDEAEIVVADDGGNGDLVDHLAGLPVRVIATGGLKSAGAARNVGARGFTGRQIVFIDADVIVEPDCLARLLAPLRDGAAEASVGNYSLDVAGLSYAARYKQLYIIHVYNRRRGYLGGDFWTAIGAIDAAVFAELGGFDARLPGACGEDNELGTRLAARAYRILAVPEATGRHERQLTFGGLIRNDWRKGLHMMGHTLNTRQRLTEHRHATPRDVAAVMLAALSFLCSIVALFSPRLGVPGLVSALVLYLVARGDLVRWFVARSEMAFWLRALPTMWLLDLLRGLCAGSAIVCTLGRRLLSGDRAQAYAPEVTRTRGA